MKLKEIVKEDKKYMMNTFGDRMPACFTHGKGCTLYDTEGNKYIDFFAGIATNSIGYAHPVYVDMLNKQLHKLTHTSSVYYVEQQVKLAKLLVENSFADKVFFANTGTEANEGAVKLVRKYFYNKGETKYKIISLNNSFHGRTMAMVAATGQEKYQKPYKPLTEGFINVDGGDIQAIKDAVDSETAGVLIETVQGEGGIVLHDADYIKKIRSLCDELGILLIIDEVQTGMGRTGKLFGYEHFAIKPDIITVAKALGGGVPIAAILATDKVSSAFEPGDHGTTFGGNPLACEAGLAVFKIYQKESLVKQAAEKGAYMLSRLQAVAISHDSIVDVRGIGLMVGIQLKPEYPAKDVMLKGLEDGFVVGSAAKNTVRLVPPLIISIEEIDKVIDWLNKVL